MPNPVSFQLTCPVPGVNGDRVVMAHGGGGKLSQRLLETVFLPAFRNPHLEALHDGAILQAGSARLAFSTDSYVVRPLEFPGGNIGDLAVNGTVNDLAMCGAQPKYLSAGFILEEGLEIALLQRIVESMRSAAERAGVQLVTGDTKVVDRGKADGVFINTSGIGLVEGPAVGAKRIEAGDAILLSGDLGAHGITILSVREGLEFEAPLVSDTAPLWEPVAALLGAGIAVHCLRDCTRGGLSSAANELAQASGLGFRLDEPSIPITDPVRGACELLGLDPLYVANEGRFIAFVPESHADLALHILSGIDVSRGACRIGTVEEKGAGRVWLQTITGGNRVVDMMSGEQLPRIC